MPFRGEHCSFRIVRIRESSKAADMSVHYTYMYNGRTVIAIAIDACQW